MTNRLIPLLLMTLLIGSCAPASASPTSTPTATVPPTRTPLPTQTAIPTATPYPPLQTEGPYLLFTYDNKNFTIMDADGSGRKQFQLPNEGYVRKLEKAVSPDGKWLAYFTGSTDEPYELALHLFNLGDGSTYSIANLIASGYPQNLEPVTETIYSTEYDTDCLNDPECKLSLVESAFTEGIRSLDWSPDSTSLAFVAQIDGPSSDIYIFNTDDKSIYRLTDDLENIGDIDWAPNGEKILYKNLMPGRVYSVSKIHIADPENRHAQHSDAIYGGRFWGEEGWIGVDSYLIWTGGEGAPPADFQYINIETQQTKVIWNPESEIFAMNSELHALVITLTPEVAKLYQTQLKPGTYFVSVDRTQTKISDEIYEPVQNQNGLINSFFARKDRELYSMKTDGSTIVLIKENVDFLHSPRLSPNKKWLMVEGYDGLQLYSENLELVKSWEIRNSEMIWRPDSVGLLLFIDTGMYYLSVLNGEPILIEDCAPDDCSSMDYVWLP